MINLTAVVDLRKRAPRFGYIPPASLPMFLSIIRGYGTRVFTATDIADLCFLGYLRADRISSTIQLDAQGLVLETSRPGVPFSYIDGRPVGTPLIAPRGIREAVKDTGPPSTIWPDLLSQLDIALHPFRFYVLASHELRLVQALQNHRRHVANSDTPPSTCSPKNHIGYGTPLPSTVDLISSANDVVDLAIISDPISIESIIDLSPLPSMVVGVTYQVDRKAYLGDGLALFRTLGLDCVRVMQRHLCSHAELLDSNTELHTALRILSPERLLGYRSRLGGALLLKMMAELIRRASESAHDVCLPEEDKVFDLSTSSARSRISGVKRVLDASRAIQRTYLRMASLDFGLGAKLYVEGSTEFGLMSTLLGPTRDVDIVNIGGRVIERNAVSFRDSLENDKRNGVLSFILLDGDLSKNVGVVRKAATDEAFLGEFYVARPDIEYGSFLPDELGQIIVNLPEADDLSPQLAEEVRRCARGASSAADLEKALNKTPELIGRFRKSERWGQALAGFAAHQPFYSTTEGTPQVRVVNLVVNRMATALKMGFSRLRAKYSLNSNSGRLEKQ